MTLNRADWRPLPATGTLTYEQRPELMWKHLVGHKTVDASVCPLHAGSQRSHMSDQTFGSDSAPSLISQAEKDSQGAETDAPCPRCKEVRGSQREA